MAAEEMVMRCGERHPNTAMVLCSSAGTGQHRSTLGSIVGALSVLLTLATSVWAQGEWIKTWVMADDASLAGLSAMAVSYDIKTGNPTYHFVYEKIAAANRQDRRLYYRRYSAQGWEDEVEVSNRIAQSAKLLTPDEGISYLPSIITSATTDKVHISARVDCTTTSVPGRSSFPSCEGAALQLEEIIVDPVNRTYTAWPIDLTHPIAHERGLSQMSITGQAVYCCWRVQHDGTDREVYCAQRGFSENAWSPPVQMTGGRAGEENHGHVLYPVNAPRRLSFTTDQVGDAYPKAVVVRLDEQDPQQQPQWITISNPRRQGDFSWLAEDSRGGLHAVWQEAPANGQIYEIWHGECQGVTTVACSNQRNWDKGAGPLSLLGRSAKYPQIVITPSDDLLVAYQQRVGGKWKIQVSYRCHGTTAWQPVTPDGQFDDQELWLGEPAFVQDPRGSEVHVVYRVTAKGPPDRVRVRWARHAYPDCTVPPLASLTCSASNKPDFSPEGVSTDPPPRSSPPPLLKRTLTGAEAKCNDGSPAVMYIRPALEPPTPTEPSHKWIIHFQGGRSCTNAEDCRARWCSEPPQASYSAGKMSATGLPPAIWSRGIFGTDNTNTFRSFNQVFVYYCSSDNWIGAASPYTYVSGSAKYSIEFRGAPIVADVIQTLKTDAGTSSDSEAVWLPDLDHATEVLFTGSSAGSIGLRHHVDGLHAQLVNDNPQVIVRAIIDVGFLPSLSHEKINWQHADSPESYEAWLTAQGEIMQSFWQTPPTALDESCLQQPQTELRQRCLDTAYVLKHHITTPFFISQDLTDKVWWQWLDTWDLLSSQSQLAQIVRDELLALRAPGIESRTFTPGIFGPNCGAHEFLPSSHFFDIAIGTETFHTTLYNWLNDQGPSVVVQPGTNTRPPYARFDGCP